LKLKLKQENIKINTLLRKQEIQKKTLDALNDKTTESPIVKQKNLFQKEFKLQQDFRFRTKYIKNHNKKLFF